MVAGVIARLAPERKSCSRVLDGDGNGSVLAVAKGIRYAVQHGARVINLSLGGTREYGVLAQVLRAATDAGVVVVAASGNDGTDITNTPPDSQV
jgi:subtilisin family serine protease